MLQIYPEADDNLIDEASTHDVEWIKAVVSGTRNIRGEMDISYATPIPVLFFNGGDDDLRRLNENQELLQFLIKPQELTWLDAGTTLPVAATQLVGEMQVLVPMKGLIDQEAESARLSKEIEKLTRDIERAEKKIQNPNFVAKAPEDVVQKERDKVADLSSALQKLIEQKQRVEAL